MYLIHLKSWFKQQFKYTNPAVAFFLIPWHNYRANLYKHRFSAHNRLVNSKLILLDVHQMANTYRRLKVAHDAAL
jgi:hypothetical protein